MKEKARSRTKILSLSVLFVSLVLLITGAMIWYKIFNQYIHPKRIEIEGSPEDYQLQFRDFEVEITDGISLKGWVVSPQPIEQNKTPVVIAVHGYNTNRWDILERISHFSKAGFMVVAYDQRACGKSEGDAVSGGLSETEDMIEVIDFVARLPEIDPDRIILYGFSMGGFVAIRAAAQDERIDLVISDSPYANLRDITRKILADENVPPWPFLDLMNWSYQRKFGISLAGVDCLEKVKKISPRAFLIIGGEEDNSVPVDNFKRIYQAAGEPKRIILLPGNDHEDNGTIDVFENHIIPFIQTHLSLPSLPDPNEVELLISSDPLSDR